MLEVSTGRAQGDPSSSGLWFGKFRKRKEPEAPDSRSRCSSEDVPRVVSRFLKTLEQAQLGVRVDCRGLHN